MKLRYKIISYSSQDIQFPITNLISEVGVWQSARFCQYPQQITVQFYQPINITSIHLVSHSSKISSRVSLLFCLPDRSKTNVNIKFEKYGYVEFQNNEVGDNKVRELKKIENINVNAEYLRLILWKNHQNIQNFFNQVGLSQLMIYGKPYINNILPPLINNKSGLMNKSIRISKLIEGKLQLLEQFKLQFIKQNDFENAKQVKEIIKTVKVFEDKLKLLEQQKNISASKQEYERAKQLKSEIQSITTEIQYITNNFYDSSKKEIKPVLRESKLKLKMDQLMSNSNNFSPDASQVSTKLKKLKMEVLDEEGIVLSEEEEEKEENNKEYNIEYNEEQTERQQIMQTSRISYDNRIVPAALKKNKKATKHLQGIQHFDDEDIQDNQFIEKNTKPQQALVLQEMTPSAQANAQILLEFYSKEIIKKLHSKHWSFKLQGLNFIIEDTKKWLSSTNQLDKKRIKSIIFIFNKCIREGNFQIYNLDLELLNLIVSAKKTYVKNGNAQSDLNYELEKTVNELFLKMNDNQKMKEKCNEVLNKMMATDVFGVQLIYQAIFKSYFNQTLTHNLKIKKYKLSAVEFMLHTYGINNKEGLPVSAVDFVCKVAGETNDELRKQATSILKQMKQNGLANKVIEAVRARTDLKGSIIKQLQA